MSKTPKIRSLRTSLKHDYHSLTLTDLLDARDAYHRHLTHLDTVIGTAVGRYFIRKSDPDFEDSYRRLKSPGDEMRTLGNSDVRPWSQPCVLVLVNHWPKLADLRNNPEQYVPPRLYLPDDRVVPTCVVYAESIPDEEAPIDDIMFAPDLLGGGFPILSEVQGESRIGSIGCLVTDGHAVYALTNRHVAGPDGQATYTISHGERRDVGAAATESIRTITFEKAYQRWSGFQTLVNLDAGLIRVNNIGEWTSQIFGVGELGELVNADADSLSLDIVGQNVRAFGAVSGHLTGTIKALFYRYRSSAGYDHVADFLIGPRDGGASVPTKDGDSGTIWLIEQDKKEEKPRPFAMQWGSSSFSAGNNGEGTEFVLASNLSIICRELDVRVITDWATGLPETWGKLGHYQIGAKACDVVSNAKLATLLSKNKVLIGLSDHDRINRHFPKNRQKAFIALADVPDLWWKTFRGKEKPSHFADMDEEGKDSFVGQTLLSLYENDPGTLNTATWHEFYVSLGIEPRYQGSLPFRVRQFYEEMVGFVQNNQLAEFIAAAGTLAHYVGDAAQPLHTSRLHHGHSAAEEGVHAQYETSMTERFRAEIVATINLRLAGHQISQTFTGAQNAAVACIELTRTVTDRLSPQDIIDSYNRAGTGRKRNEDLWADLGDETIECMIDGALCLATIWESAWIEGGGDTIPEADLVRISKTKLKKLYKDKSFLEPQWLEDM